MTLKLVISTFAGGFIFPFLIRLLWDKMVKDWGSIGGWMAAGFIVGTTWTLTHGVGLIHQSGGVWVDQAFAAASGLLAASVASGDSLIKAVPNIFFGIIGGIIGGFILFTFI